MPLQSMTGFARADGGHAATRFHWELRSVNGRSLDVRLRLPAGQDALEQPVRTAIAKCFARGNISATLSMEQAADGATIRINSAALETVLAALKQLDATNRFDKPRPEGVLALKGVIEVGSTEPDQADVLALRSAVLASLEEALDALTRARREEGGRLAAVIAGSVARIEVIVERIAAVPGRRPEVIAARLCDLVERLMGSASGLDADRLHQEAVLQASRVDVEEELKRLSSHILAARELLADGVPVGRRFDFLSQEFNREANTICSKANDIEITRLGLELKAVVDQVREQVQNIE